MSPVIINGKEVSAKIRGELSAKIEKAVAEGKARPGLAVILVGEDPASQVYVRNKEKACEEVGITSYVYRMPADTSEEELLEKIELLNSDSNVNGILVQLPLPRHIDEYKVICSISPDKDVDAFHPVNAGKMLIGKRSFLPCTPAGVIELLDHYGIDPSGKSCVVVGRSNIVGKPQALLLLQRDATVTVCHSRTVDLASVTSGADILVSAVGRAKFIRADMVKEGAVVIDVGMNRDENGKLCGDVDYAEVAPKCSAITPVPGGVGPMTITMLMANALRAAGIE